MELVNSAPIRLELIALAREAGRCVSGSSRHVQIHARINYLLGFEWPSRVVPGDMTKPLPR